MRALRQYTNGRRLGVEKLEARWAPAVAAFTVNLYDDAEGTPGDLIVEDTVQVGDTLFVEIMARELNPLTTGFQGVSLDISWDPQVLQEIDAPFNPGALITPHLPVFLTGTLNGESGTIEDLGGSAFPAFNIGRPIGNLRPERFALLHFRALQPAENSALAISQGRSRIATMPVSSLPNSQIDFESQTITVLPPDSAPAAEIDVSPTSGSDSGIQFSTATVGGDSASPLVRPAFPDNVKFVDVTNSGDSPLTILEVQVNVPDVTVSGPADPFVLEPGETHRLGLTYAPTTPSPSDAAAQSFDVADGLVIVSDAENAPVVEVRLRGESTFDADINYNGSVDVGDLTLFQDHFGAQEGDAVYSPQIDPNADGIVDLADFVWFNMDIGRSRSLPETPEVTTLATASADSAEAEGIPETNQTAAESPRETIDTANQPLPTNHDVGQEGSSIPTVTTHLAAAPVYGPLQVAHSSNFADAPSYGPLQAPAVVAIQQHDISPPSAQSQRTTDALFSGQPSAESGNSDELEELIQLLAEDVIMSENLCGIP